MNWPRRGVAAGSLWAARAALSRTAATVVAGAKFTAVGGVGAPVEVRMSVIARPAASAADTAPVTASRPGCGGPLGHHHLEFGQQARLETRDGAARRSGIRPGDRFAARLRRLLDASHVRLST